eukprot:14110745-Ditylum_brightwellii.AAC.1
MRIGLRGELDQIELLLLKSREKNWIGSGFFYERAESIEQNWIGSGFFYERAERRIGLDWASFIREQREELDWIGLLLLESREETWIGLDFFYQRAEKRIGLDWAALI